ncbi:phosphoenolpyruvate carboxykinase (ATP) [Hymenobacter sp. BRD128]|uniref:phosphoenolpyruvate carboxykinase (ATP) n=1 Tax=Hymenobacter sp. BRD128 TaxID=2675878 RepID=UPI001566FAF9|nr:phosphoenolpyruvate carboxykinase (ATP) [Hymenobacter sp. BRD128]QKG56247.1 phosphoenolpyruvate carboxykinase (ATP) [Hymenobacter sp. BRD128]
MADQKAVAARLAPLGFAQAPTQAHLNLPPAALVSHALRRGEGTLTDTGALMADTGQFTGRSPKDRFVVRDENTADSVWWGDINLAFDPAKFAQLHQKMVAYLAGKEVFVRDAYAGANPDYQLKLRVVNELAWHNLFCYNMFLRPETGADTSWTPDFSIICAPGFEADPAVDGTRQKNFAIIDFTRKLILIGGTGYAGEMKKGIFGVLNYLLPHERATLPMHCSANVGASGDTAIFFGLSGTGKTTLSTDPNRGLIGDDEHGWTPDAGIFNFEGGCYAKVIDLSRAKEPEIWDAIRFGAIVENTRFVPGTHTVDFANKSITENTRTAYPISFIANAIEPSVAGAPTHIFFLTADAFGVLPPISKLDKCHAMYHFMSGYTAKVAGTEMGITEPQTTFSACFGQVFLPLHPTRYAEMLGQKMDENPEINVWLINTGWTGGSYGTGHRMKLGHTRAMITAALSGVLTEVHFKQHPIFGVAVPGAVPGVPTEILDPRNTWANKAAYDQTAAELAEKFVKNFEKYADFASADILAGAPKMAVEA